MLQTSQLSGFGFTNHCPFFDPTDVAEDNRQVKIMNHFNQTPERLDTLLQYPNSVQSMSVELSETILVYNDLSQASETKVNNSLAAVGKDRTVQKDHLDKIMTRFGQYMQTKMQMSTLDCPLGFGKVLARRLLSG